MIRLMLTDEHWSRLRPIMRENGIYDKRNLRKTVEGILYRMRTGLPWRDLPPFFGQWISIYQQFNRWSLKHKLIKIFKALVRESDCHWEFIDSSFVKAHQHCHGATSHNDQAIGQSRGGNNTKIHIVTESSGLPLDFTLTGGEVPDVKMAPQLLLNVPAAGYLIADRGYDSEKIRTLIRNNGSIPMIPRKRNSIVGNSDMDWRLYKYRHRVENLFARLKHFRAIATRYDKLKRNYAAILAMACSYIWLTLSIVNSP